MKSCTKCGAELADEAVVCPKCGCATENGPFAPAPATQQMPTIRTIAKVFMILGCVLNAFYFIIPLAWCIPMTLSYCRKIEAHQPVSTGFKVCCLLFVSLIGGVCMLCDNNPA